MNRHLNIFRPFSQNLSKENIEDNLSRAFVLSLENNSLFLHEFLRTVFAESNQEDLFKNMFADVSQTDACTIDIQVETTEVEKEFSKVFALAMSGKQMDMSGFHDNTPDSFKKHKTDIFISINDIAIVIEVKRDNTDCRKQLYKQVAAFTEDITIDTVFPLDFNWRKLMTLANRIQGFQTLMSTENQMLSNFIDLVQGHNANWLPVPPLASINNNAENIPKIKRRIVATLKNLESQGEKALNYHDRIGLELKFGWAKEIVINLRAEHSIKEEGNKTSKVNLRFGIWPGNTKGQGTQVLKRLKGKENWTPPKEIVINDRTFKVEWGYEFKFCHFNRFVSNIIVSDQHIKPGKILISSLVHWNHTGKYEKNQWNALEAFLDEYLVDNYDWRKELDWKGNFLETGRNYLTLSIGHQIETIVPVEYLQTIDTKMDNLEPMSAFIINLKTAYKNLFE
jgi:hypothetical protein